MLWSGHKCRKIKVMRISKETSPAQVISIRNTWRMWNISTTWVA
jgi:hypothetical protein